MPPINEPVSKLFPFLCGAGGAGVVVMGFGAIDDEGITEAEDMTGEGFIEELLTIAEEEGMTGEGLIEEVFTIAGDEEILTDEEDVLTMKVVEALYPDDDGNDVFAELSIFPGADESKRLVETTEM